MSLAETANIVKQMTQEQLVEFCRRYKVLWNQELQDFVSLSDSIDETYSKFVMVSETNIEETRAPLHSAMQEALDKGILQVMKPRIIEGMKTGQGEKVKTEHGATRESNAGRGRFDLLPYEALEAWAIWSELGAIKYGDRNWEKGISVKDCINRMTRHAAKASAGMTDEDHLAAVMWNAGAAITMMKRRPDCNDHPWIDSEKINGKLQCTSCGSTDVQIINNGFKVHIATFCNNCHWQTNHE